MDAASLKARTTYDVSTFIARQKACKEDPCPSPSGTNVCRDFNCLLQRENAKSEAKHSAYEVELLSGQLKEKNSEIAWLRSQMDRQCDQISMLTHAVKEREESPLRRLGRHLAFWKKRDSPAQDSTRTNSDRETVRKVFG
jgi:hypothetical protein